MSLLMYNQLQLPSQWDIFQYFSLLRTGELVLLRTNELKYTKVDLIYNLKLVICIFRITTLPQCPCNLNNQILKILLPDIKQPKGFGNDHWIKTPGKKCETKNTGKGWIENGIFLLYSVRPSTMIPRQIIEAQFV